MNNDLRYYGNPMNWESTKGDLISRSALLKAFAESNHIKETASGLDVMEMLAIKEIIDNAPTVDLTKNQAYDKGFITAMKLYARPKGKWHYFDEYLNGGTFYITECPFCHLRVLEITNFCPDCGADMRGDKE